MHFNVIDHYTGAIERPNDGGREPRATAHWRPEPSAILAGVNRPLYERIKDFFYTVVWLLRERYLQDRRARGCLEFGWSSLSYYFPVVYDGDLVSQGIGFFEILGG
jgi:hypothetical protein